jgi:hypothetical protein
VLTATAATPKTNDILFILCILLQIIMRQYYTMYVVVNGIGKNNFLHGAPPPAHTDERSPFIPSMRLEM